MVYNVYKLNQCFCGEMGRGRETKQYYAIIIIWYSYHVSSSYIMFVMSAGSRFWARLWSAGKGVTGEGLWFDMVESWEWLVRRCEAMCGGWNICIQSSVSNEFAWICSILSKSGESCLGYQMLLCFLKPWISVGQLLPRLELNQIVWTMIATARLFLRQQWTTAQTWDTQKGGFTKGRAM